MSGDTDIHQPLFSQQLGSSSHICVTVTSMGGAENAGVENAGVEEAGVDRTGGICRSGKKAGVDSSGGKCRSGKYRS